MPHALHPALPRHLSVPRHISHTLHLTHITSRPHHRSWGMSASYNSDYANVFTGADNYMEQKEWKDSNTAGNTLPMIEGEEEWCVARVVSVLPRPLLCVIVVVVLL